MTKNNYVTGFLCGKRHRDDNMTDNSMNNMLCQSAYGRVAYNEWIRYGNLGWIELADFCCGQYDGAMFGVMVNF